MPRKGLPCALAMVDGLLEGVALDEADRIFFVDIIPNTPAGKDFNFCFVDTFFRAFIFIIIIKR